MAQIAFTLFFEGSQETPPNGSSAIGTGLVIFDTTTNTASYVWQTTGVDFGPIRGLPEGTPGVPTDNVTGFHFHSAPRGSAAGVVFDIPGQDADDLQVLRVGAVGNTWRVSGAWEPTDPANQSINNFAAALAAAPIGSDVNLYANIHTQAFGGGEIRAQWVTSANDAANNVVGTVRGDFLHGLGGNDTVSGLAGDDDLSGGDGADTMFGGDGNDRLDGGAGVDDLTGNAGDDTYVVDNVNDLVNEAAGVGSGTDTVLSSVSYSLNGNVEQLTLTGTAALNGNGNGLNNVLVGNSGKNFLNGRTGADQMIGGVGNDSYVVDNVGDTVIESAGEGIDSITTVISLTLPTAVERLTLSGTGNIDGTGNGLANVLIGNSGDNALSGAGGHDRLMGGAGNDKLTGGIGNDRLTGELGADSFVYAGSGNGVDTITDFSGQTAFGGGAGQGDRFVFEDVLVGTFAYRGSLGFTGTGNTEARVSSGKVIVDADGNGAGDVTIVVAGLTSASQLVAADFQFI